MLKKVTVISSGGQAKWYLAENTVLVDGEPENRRGRKLYPGMMVEVPEVGTFFMGKKGGNRQLKRLNKLYLKNYRNYQELKITFTKNLACHFFR